MKKIGKLFLAFSLVISSLFMISCDDLLNDIIGDLCPKDEWYVFQKEIKCDDSTTADVQIWFYYSDTGFTSSSLRDDVKIGEGLTMLILPDTDNDTQGDGISALFGNVAAGVDPLAVKTFAKGEPISEKLSNVEVNDRLWTVLYYIYLGEKSEPFADGCPGPIQKYMKNKVTLVTEEFDWSTFLEQIIVSKVASNL